MSERDGNSVGDAGSGGTGRLAGLLGIGGGVLLIAGLIGFPELPSSEVSAPDVYAFFLDEDGDVGRPAALMIIGLLLAAVLFAVLRSLLAGRRSSSAAAGAMLALAQIGIGLQVAALTVLEILSLRPSEADPATSRALLDLSEVLAAISGAALALALAAAALAIRRRQPGPLPPRFAIATLIAAIGPALWAVRLFSDSESFDADSLLGSSLGWILLVAWLLAAGAWLLGRSGPEADLGMAPVTAPRATAADGPDLPLLPEPRSRHAARFQTRPRPDNSARLTPRPPAPDRPRRRFEPPPPLADAPRAPIGPEPEPEPGMDEEPEEIAAPPGPEPETESEFAEPAPETEAEAEAQSEPEPEPEADEERDDADEPAPAPADDEKPQ